MDAKKKQIESLEQQIERFYAELHELNSSKTGTKAWRLRRRRVVQEQIHALGCKLRQAYAEAN